jgi:UDP-glucuronate decarboxylase
MSLFENSLMKHYHFNYDIASDVAIMVQRSGLNLQSLRGKRVLITGGTGFFGVWLLSALSFIKRSLGGEFHIYVITRSSANVFKNAAWSGFLAEVELIQGDVRDVKFLADGITHLVHMATTNASETFAGEDQLNKFNVLYEGTRNVLEQCTDSLESVLFTSSGVAYGKNQCEKIVESELGNIDTTELGSALALGKLTAEYLVANYATRLHYKFSIARCFSFAGQYLPLNLHYAFGNFIKNAQDRRDIIVLGDGLDKRSYLYIGDAVAWLLRMMSEPKNQIVNVGSERSVSMKELAVLIARRAGVGVQIKGMSSEIGNFKRSSYVPSTLKARQLYPGLKEWTPLETIIRKMLIGDRL